MAHTFPIGSRSIGDDQPCYIIAEIGQNHQGDMELAKRLICAAKDSGADCVKFQKSCLPEKFTAAALRQPYTSPNAWAPTYGAHKQHLEFSIEQFAELQQYAEHSVGIAFTASGMDLHSVLQLHELNVPFIKIGSGDANNIPLLEAAAKLRRPLVISTGMLTERMIGRIVAIMQQQQGGSGEYALLHCVSAYPVEPAAARLRMVTQLRERFPATVVGYSGHERGTAITLGSVVLGAKVVERHFTLDPTLKGTDHQLSLTPNRFGLMVQRIRAIERLCGSICGNPTTADQVLATISAANIQLSHSESDELSAALAPLSPRTADTDMVADCERDCWQKLGKSLVYAAGLEAGHLLQPGDVCFKVSPEKGLLDGDYDALFGRRLAISVAYEEPVAWRQLE